MKAMFQNAAGKGALCFLGIIFLAVSIVYFVYIWRPGKFRKELAGERMTPKFFTFCVIIARIGALGRYIIIIRNSYIDLFIGLCSLLHSEQY